MRLRRLPIAGYRPALFRHESARLIYRFFLCLFLSAALIFGLSACRVNWAVSSSSGDGEDEGFFFIFVSSGFQDSDGVPQVDPAIDSGRFVVHLNFAHPSDEFFLFLSQDAQINSSDPLVGAMSCGQNSRPCNSAMDVSCFYRSDMTVQCTGDTATDVSSFFSQLPQRAYLLAQSCRQGGTVCENSSFLLEFR